jgi:hypothetical protein
MKRLLVPLIVFLLFSNDCSNSFLYVQEPENMPMPCDRACEVLKAAECPEGTYNMCHHYRSDECAKQINVGCVMKAHNRQEIITCGVKCEW